MSHLFGARVMSLVPRSLGDCADHRDDQRAAGAPADRGRFPVVRGALAAATPMDNPYG